MELPGTNRKVRPESMLQSAWKGLYIDAESNPAGIPATILAVVSAHVELPGSGRAKVVDRSRCAPSRKCYETVVRAVNIRAAAPRASLLAGVRARRS